MPKLLILSSNPRRDLNLNREISDLTSEIQRLGRFELRFGFEVRAQELSALLAEHSPQFVHFCGHGAGEQGLVFQDENGGEQFVSTEILSRIFRTFSDEINCTVLNACDSVRQAEAIVEHINYVIGMRQPILDKAALLFSVFFYKGLGAGTSIEQAYEMGCIAIQIWWSQTQSQSTQSRQYRKLEYAGDVVKPSELQLAEYLKPVLLKKSEHFPSSVAESGSVPKVSSSSASFEPSQEFVEYVRQVINRKEYKDNARAAYDNFGSARNAATLDKSKPDKSEYEQRKILLGKVKQFWIEGFLQPSLQGVDPIRLDLKARPDAIADLTQGIEALSVELDASYERLRDTRIYEEMGQGQTLLILGSPGAGKTIALLQLAQRLIERSELDLSVPIPVVFNLSSWAKDRKLIVDWLIDELREKYQVPKSLSEPWIQRKQLILLLDGLDEVKEEYRDNCVRALNQFIGRFPRTEVAVCSRVRDYEALTERLQISSALCLQPLSSEQVYQSLDGVGGSLAGLKTLLKRDAELEQFAQTPLILNFMSVAYQGWSVGKLIPELHSPPEQREQNLFNTYIDCRLDQGSTPEYSKDQVRHWLSWLASQMVREKQTIFLIEKMQPTWLENQCEERTYIICNFLMAGLIVALVIGLVMGCIDGIIILGLIFGENTLKYIEMWKSENAGRGVRHALYYALNCGLPDGLKSTHSFSGFSNVVRYGIESLLTYGKSLLMYILTGGCIGGCIGGLPKEITLFEQMSLSWQKTKSMNVRKVSLVLFVGLAGGLISGYYSNLIQTCGRKPDDICRRAYKLIQTCDLTPPAIDPSWKDMISGLDPYVSMIYGLIVGLTSGLIFWLCSDLESSEIKQKTLPNQGIWISAKNAVKIGFSIGLIYGFSIGLIRGVIEFFVADKYPYQVLIDGLWEMHTVVLFIWPVIGLLIGGKTCIQHFTLRKILHQKGRIPWNYAKFLDFVSNRLLMKKVGGGYVFFHRMLLEHFARMKQD